MIADVTSRQLVDWANGEIDDVAARQQNLHLGFAYDEQGVCQCCSEIVIRLSSDPRKMRAVLMIGALFDQVCHHYFRCIHEEFEAHFGFPKLWSHSFSGCASPAWFVYKVHGYDRHANWAQIKIVFQTMIREANEWFDSQSPADQGGVTFDKFKEKLWNSIHQ